MALLAHFCLFPRFSQSASIRFIRPIRVPFLPAPPPPPPPPGGEGTDVCTHLLAASGPRPAESRHRPLGSGQGALEAFPVAHLGQSLSHRRQCFGAIR